MDDKEAQVRSRRRALGVVGIGMAAAAAGPTMAQNATEPSGGGGGGRGPALDDPRTKQLGPKGIRVNGVAPGPIWTPLQISGGAPPEKYEKFGSTNVFGRPGQPAELASINVQLVASDASFATGNRDSREAPSASSRSNQRRGCIFLRESCGQSSTMGTSVALHPHRQDGGESTPMANGGLPHVRLRDLAHDQSLRDVRRVTSR